jgi:putative oxidoreductase
MEIISLYHESIAVFVARTFLGCLFFFQGYDAVFNIKISSIIETYRNDFSNKGIPRFVTVIGSWYTSLTELVCGALLLLGLFQYLALALLGLNLLMVAFAFGMNTPLWDTRYVLPRLILLIFLLCVPPSWDLWSIDALLGR